MIHFAFMIAFAMPPQTFALLVAIFVIGAIIGSFLNVVIYRLPRGMSLMRPASQCPKCSHPIRWYDNVPILGWFLLDGKCHDCGTQISRRYPLVEFAVGLMFLALGWSDWVQPQRQAKEVAAAQAEARATAQIEGGPANFAAEGERNSPETEINLEEYLWPLGFHLLLLCPLLAAMLIDFDDQRLPRQLITWPAAVGMLLAMFWPAVQVFPLLRAQRAAEGFSFYPFATSFIGLMSATFVRIGTQNIFGVARAREMGLSNCMLALYGVGAFLGWQAVLLVSVLSIVWSLLRETPLLKGALFYIRPTAVLFLATLIWCLTERHLNAGL
jgi:prepilin signal peptidase PulO-like enzyme (type II secretory pathway)